MRLFIILSFLSVWVAHCNPLDIITSTFESLKQSSDELWNEMQRTSDDKSVWVKAKTHTDDSQLNGCGLYISGTGKQGQFHDKTFPSTRTYACPGTSPNDGLFEMRVIFPNRSYKSNFGMSSDQTMRVELHADGWKDTYLKDVCVGFNRNTLPDAPRSFCINEAFLKGCRGILPERQDTSIGLHDKWIQLTRSNRGYHKIIFENPVEILKGFEQLRDNPQDVDGKYKMCDRIILVRGTDPENFTHCYARKVTFGINSEGFKYPIFSEFNKDPYGCSHRDAPRRLKDCDDNDSETCENYVDRNDESASSLRGT